MRVSSSLVLFWRILQVSVTLATRQVPLDTGLTDAGQHVDFQNPLATEDAWLHGFEPSMLKPVPLAVNRNSTNRVNLVYFGDGYTEEERATFLQDAQFLTDTLLQPGGAFSAVRDLLNFWALLLPSTESGIGTYGKPRNTTFGLYRPGEELRAVFYACPERVTAACKALNGDGFAGGCDEPILLGNDPFYGGLGGTPTVITASRNNGVQVLRHELGHTLIPVGEEYDGGYAYFGANAAPHSNTTKQDVPWKQWLSATRGRSSGGARVEDSRVAVQQYPWLDLSNCAYTARFDDHGGNYPTALLRFSVSGIPTEDRLTIKLDGQDLECTFSEDHRGSLDRTWVQIELEDGLHNFGSGDGHRLQFTASAASSEVRPMLSSVEVIEYGPAEKFNKTPGNIGAYPTVDADGGITLRPTNEGCLMRDVTVPTFCSVCLEGLTLSLLGRVSLVESSHIECSTTQSDDDVSNPHATVALNLFHTSDVTYAITWYKGATELHHFANQTTIQLPTSADTATLPAWYTAKVELSLPQVRLQGREEMKEQVKIWYQGCD